MTGSAGPRGISGVSLEIFGGQDLSVSFFGLFRVDLWSFALTTLLILSSRTGPYTPPTFLETRILHGLEILVCSAVGGLGFSALDVVVDTIAWRSVDPYGIQDCAWV